MHFEWVKSAARSFRVRMVLWNAAAVATVGFATAIGLRFAIQAALMSEMDTVLHRDAEEIRLDLLQKFPGAEQSLFDDLTRKAQAHELHGWYVRLIDGDGRQLWASPHAPPQTPMVPGRNGLAIVNKGNYRVAEFVHRPASAATKELTVRVGSSLAPMQREMSRIDRYAILMSALVCVLSPVAGVWLAGTVIRPLDELLRRAELIGPNRLSERLNVRGVGDELDQLSITINRLLDRLAEYMRRRQDFLTNAAHELRTPLAAIRNTLEVALDRHRTVEQYEETLVRLTEECGALEMLVNQLLLLAEAENSPGKATRESLDWANVVRSATSMFEAAAEFKGVMLQAELTQGLLVRANRQHLRQVVNNLIDNAIKYTQHGGAVQVALRRREAEGMAELEVSDTGVGIREEDVSRVFERFFRGDKARQKEAGVGGTGLGLSICETLVASMGGTIHLESQLGRGTTVRVRLPVVVS
ncbi:MAG: ATP-binding protein [Pirellulales bacterium]